MSFFKPHHWQQQSKVQPRLALCGKCGLYKKCNSPKMKASGKGKHPILFVAEAPGAREDDWGTQLVGKSGLRLRKTLRKLGVDLDDCWKTNAVICRPPKNQIKPLHIECCRPNLLKTVRALKPRVIVLLGGSAVRSLIPTDREGAAGKIGKWVGWTIPSEAHRAWICPTYHPSFLIRMKDPVLSRLFRQHIAQALSLEKRRVACLPLEDLKKEVEVITSPRLFRLRMNDLSKKTGVLAFDYETTGLKPDRRGHRIVTASFCLNGRDTFAGMVDERNHRSLLKVLLKRSLLKAGANIKHEERWSRALLGHPVAGWYWDTMLGSHLLDNRGGGISSLKFHAYIYFGIAKYNNAVEDYLTTSDELGFNYIDDCPKDGLLLYNGLDSLLTYKVMLKQRKQMGFKRRVLTRRIVK